MKKIVLALLAAVLMLSAVEWDVEQVTDVSALTIPSRPLLALDNEGYARVLFRQRTIEVEKHLYCASNTTGSWVIRDVDSNYSCDVEYYDIDIDSEGNTNIVYTIAWEQDENYDVFYATDETGPFVPQRLTTTGGLQYAMNIAVDLWDKPHITYMKYDSLEWETYLFCGWIDEAYELHAQKVTDNSIDGEEGSDLVAGSDGVLHIFYVDDYDYYLWHIYGELSAWGEEVIVEHSSYLPSAAVDESGNLHLSYLQEDFPQIAHYAKNVNGLWFDETISGEEPPHWTPCLALDQEGIPYVQWHNNSGIFYTSKPGTDWIGAEFIDVPQQGIELEYGQTFLIDEQGFGHLIYIADDEEEQEQVFYAKSKQPLSGGGFITEQVDVSNPHGLEVRGSKIRFTLPQSSPVTLNLYDAVGRHVDHLASGIYAAGEHAAPINTADLSSGVYFIRAEIAERSASAKFVLTH